MGGLETDARKSVETGRVYSTVDEPEGKGQGARSVDGANFKVGTAQNPVPEAACPGSFRSCRC